MSHANSSYFQLWAIFEMTCEFLTTEKMVEVLRIRHYSKNSEHKSTSETTVLESYFLFPYIHHSL